MPSKAYDTKARPWKTPVLPHGKKEYARPVGAEWPTDIPERNRFMRHEVSQLKGQLSDAFTAHTLSGFTHDQIKVMVYKYHVLMIVTTKVTTRTGKVTRTNTGSRGGLPGAVSSGTRGQRVSLRTPAQTAKAVNMGIIKSPKSWNNFQVYQESLSPPLAKDSMDSMDSMDSTVLSS